MLKFKLVSFRKKFIKIQGKDSNPNFTVVILKSFNDFLFFKFYFQYKIIIVKNDDGDGEKKMVAFHSLASC